MNGKRTMDIGIALFLLPLLGIVSPVMWLAGKLSGLPSILFRQERIGKNGQVVRIVKFRSLKPVGDELRSNAFYRFVRKTGLDELPQILLVLRGTMSVIGPRPLLEEDLCRTNKEENPDLNADIRIRQSTRPGMTGLPLLLIPSRRFHGDAYRRMLDLDVWYVRNRSLLLDLLIILLTVVFVISRGRIQMPELLIDEYALPMARHL